MYQSILTVRDAIYQLQHHLSTVKIDLKPTKTTKLQGICQDMSFPHQKTTEYNDNNNSLV